MDNRIFGGRVKFYREKLIFKTKVFFQGIKKVSKNPIVIGGCERSGTTLMLSLLTSHPNIYCIPYETGALIPGYSSETYKKIKESNNNPLRVYKIYNLIIKKRVKKRWCEKTPKNVHFADRILGYFGEGARFINMVRDGRSVVTSKHVLNKSKYWVSPNQWVTDVKAGLQLEDHPQVITIRYEDLTSDYMKTLERICAFIDEPFTEREFKNYPETGKTLTMQHSSREPREVQKQSDDRWKAPEHRGGGRASKHSRGEKTSPSLRLP